MKKITIAFCAVCVSYITITAQNTVVTDDPGYTAHSSAMLDVKSLNKGFLIPRMNTFQMGLINPVATGLLVFNTDINGFCYYNGTNWINLSSQMLPEGVLPNQALFAIRNASGDTVFAVYPEGVRINVGNGLVKGSGNKGGFAVGGLSGGKTYQEFLRVTNDSVRVYVNNNPTKGSGNKGGFAVGGFSGGKADVIDFFRINPKNYAIGHESGLKITDGIYNCFLGYQAGKEVRKAESNVFIGYQAGMNSTGTGAYWWEGGLNVFVGYKAGLANTLGGQNIAIGYESMISNTIGNFNIGLGVFALNSNTTGDDNIAIGKQALYDNIDGYENIGLGQDALRYNIAGHNNVALGGSCLNLNDSGSYNIGIGVAALVKNKKGESNIGIGLYTLWNYENGNYNIAIGESAGDMNSVVAYDNTTLIGYQAQVYNSNQIRLGNSSVTNIGGQVNWEIMSDGRFKENMAEDVPGLSFILKLKPVTYNMNIHKVNEFRKLRSEKDWEGKYDIEKIRFSGFVAQDVEKAANDVGYNFSGVVKPKSLDSDTYSLRYAEFTVPLVKAVQEQQAMIEELKAEIERLKKEMEQLKK